MHGLRGEVSVRMLTDLPLECFEGLHVWIAPPVSSLGQTEVLGVRPGPKGPLFALAGVNDPSMASALCGRTLMAREADIPELPEEDDPVGLVVTDESRGLLGTVEDVIVTGANDVWVVKGETYGEVLIPVIDDVIMQVDYDAGTARVKLLRGLIEDERS